MLPQAPLNFRVLQLLPLLLASRREAAASAASECFSCQAKKNENSMLKKNDEWLYNLTESEWLQKVMTEAYDELTKLAIGTPCQLTLLDTRALYRLSQWMRAYCEKRRNGAMPPSGETAAASYYMVSFFLSLLSTSRPVALEDVNRLFDRVLPLVSSCFILFHLVSSCFILFHQLPLVSPTASCFINCLLFHQLQHALSCSMADGRQYAARHCRERHACRKDDQGHSGCRESQNAAKARFRERLFRRRREYEGAFLESSGSC
jgi:hypothetical protein